MTIRDVGRLFKDAGVKFIDDKATRLAAAIAYYTALSISPLILIVVAIAGWIFGADAARGGIQIQMREILGQQGADTIQDLILKSAASKNGVFAAVIGIITLVIGATGVFVQLQDSLNTIWKIAVKEQEPESTLYGIWILIKERLLSFSLICGMAFLLLVSLVVSAFVNAIGITLEKWLPGWVSMVSFINLALSYVLTVVLFALIFKILPDIDMAWSDVWLGSALTAGLFALGKYLIGLYLGRSTLGSMYGAAGSFVILLVWIYYSSLIVLYGAEMTFLFAHRFGSGVRAPDGTPLEEVKSETVIAREALTLAAPSLSTPDNKVVLHFGLN